jgi:hypothetical protein
VDAKGEEEVRQDAPCANRRRRAASAERKLGALPLSHRRQSFSFGIKAASHLLPLGRLSPLNLRPLPARAILSLSPHQRSSEGGETAAVFRPSSRSRARPWRAPCRRRTSRQGASPCDSRRSGTGPRSHRRSCASEAPRTEVRQSPARNAADAAADACALTPPDPQPTLNQATVGQAVLVNPADDDKSLVYVSLKRGLGMTKTALPPPSPPLTARPANEKNRNRSPRSSVSTPSSPRAPATPPAQGPAAMMMTTRTARRTPRPQRCA